MKKILFLFYCARFCTGSIMAQKHHGDPDDPPCPTCPPWTAYYDAPLTYVRTYTPMKPIQDASMINMSAEPENIFISTEYKDSYGRTVQTVAKKGSPLRKDFVTPGKYDGIGNMVVSYPGFAEQVDSLNDGKFKHYPFY